MPDQVGAAVSETDSGVVFFVGDRAYKLKKPLDLGFLDFSTRERRETRACGLWAFDRNPTHLRELPPKESARKHVKFMGGADSIMPKARAAPSKPVRRAGPRGSSTTSCSPTREPEARDLLAQVHDRLGRGSEGGTWRNFNLQGAAEPRGKKPTNIFATLIALLNFPTATSTSSPLRRSIRPGGERHRVPHRPRRMPLVVSPVADPLVRRGKVTLDRHAAGALTGVSAPADPASGHLRIGRRSTRGILAHQRPRPRVSPALTRARPMITTA
jgi:hypothetical protein